MHLNNVIFSGGIIYLYDSYEPGYFAFHQLANFSMEQSNEPWKAWRLGSMVAFMADQQYYEVFTTTIAFNNPLLFLWILDNGFDAHVCNKTMLHRFRKPREKPHQRRCWPVKLDQKLRRLMRLISPLTGPATHGRSLLGMYAIATTTASDFAPYYSAFAVGLNRPEIDSKICLHRDSLPREPRYWQQMPRHRFARDSLEIR